MTVSIIVSPDGRARRIDCEQQQMCNLLGGALTFVGVLPECNAVLLALREGDTLLLERHVWNDTKHMLFPDGDIVYGSIAIVASDDEGQEIDLEIDEVVALLELKLES